MSAFSLYVIGFLVLLAGLGYGACLLHGTQSWIIVGALVAMPPRLARRSCAGRAA
jgi:hypothetical protein